MKETEGTDSVTASLRPRDLTANEEEGRAGKGRARSRQQSCCHKNGAPLMNARQHENERLEAGDRLPIQAWHETFCRKSAPSRHLTMRRTKLWQLYFSASRRHLRL